VWHTDESGKPPAAGVAVRLVIDDGNPLTTPTEITRTTDANGRIELCLQYPLSSVMRVESNLPAYPSIPVRVPNVLRVAASCS
jgi:5-hydroxyisourate hydrolase-like protein (transthyretin family)